MSGWWRILGDQVWHVERSGTGLLKRGVVGWGMVFCQCMLEFTGVYHCLPTLSLTALVLLVGPTFPTHHHHRCRHLIVGGGRGGSGSRIVI